MPRIRSIKPETPRDAKLAKVPREVRYTFLLLLTVVDDEGFFVATPRSLVGALYPHDSDMTEAILTAELDRLLALGLLLAYDTEDGVVGRMANFKKHQRIDHPTKSYLAKRSRKPRESFAPRVLSLDLGVLSPESRKKDKDNTGAAAPLDFKLPKEAEAVGHWYGRALRPICRPTPLSDPGTEQSQRARDISVLKRQLANTPRPDVEDAVAEARAQAEAGQLPGFIGPGENFGLMALLADANGGIATFERFRHAAVKRREADAA